jgi:two-component system, NtrC family, sensor kinase
VSRALPPAPGPDAVARAVVALAGVLPGEPSERELIEAFLAVAAPLVPDRAIAVRVVELRGRDPVRIYLRGAAARAGVETERVVLSAAALARVQVKSAVTASARLRVDDRWDSPFTGIGSGLALPLAAGGELYGVLDLGYPPGAPLVAPPVADDAAAIAPLADLLAVGLRGRHLHHDTVELRDYQARLIEHANALIVGIDKSWRITVANRALLDLTGFTRDEVLGRDLRDFLPRDQRAHITARFRSALDGELQSALDITLVSRKTGRVRTVWTVAAVGKDGAGSPIEAVVAIGTDQSRLQELENQVIRAERLATLGKLAAGVVHELNNPLTSITVYAEYLLKKLEDIVGDHPGITTGDLEKLRRIGASAHRIQRFARELVQYARPPGIEVETIDFNDVIRQSLSICEHLFEKAAIELVVELDDELPPIQAVPGQLEQVVINLVTNAAHAVDSGGTIRARTRRDHAHVALEIADTGPGVPSGDRERIFEPFYTTKPDGKGTGLGLPIVRNIIEQHKGQIAVDTSDLGGAMFVVKLPSARS